MFLQAGQLRHIPRAKPDAVRAGESVGMVTSLWVGAGRACHCSLPRRTGYAAASPALPEGWLNKLMALRGYGRGPRGLPSQRVRDGCLSNVHLPPRSVTQRPAVPG